MKIIRLSALLLMLQLVTNAQDAPTLIPLPVSVEMKTGYFIVDRNIVIAAENIPQLLQSAGLLKRYLDKKYNLAFPLTGINLAENKRSVIFRSLKPGKEKDAYRIIINSKNITIHTNSPAGGFYAIQTLLQLLPEKQNTGSLGNYALQVPQLSIYDYPGFQYRGMHLDVCRHFMPVEVVKRYIDHLAMFKFNRFHWHLTDDQGWRIEIKKYPKLTQVGAWRNGTVIGRYPGTGNDSISYGGYYTQEQIKEVVKYAADRFITVIPEIEMPGHASAAIAAYPQLSCFPDEDTKFSSATTWAGSTKGKQVQQTWGVFEDVFCPSESTFTFLQDVLDEVIRLFPSQYIHIGGDECPKDAWKRSAFCQQLIKEKELKDEHELQSYFIQRIEKYINSKGRKIIGWDEILEGGLAPNATVMSWRGEEGGIAAAKLQHDVIMTPGEWCYFDHSQVKNDDSLTIGGYTPLEKVYGYNPVPSSLDSAAAKHILGAQANMWTEYIGNPSKLEYMLFPRMLALSELLWTPKERRDWRDFRRRLPVRLQQLKNKKINFSSAYENQ